MRWKRIAWAAVIAFLLLLSVSHLEDQIDSKEGFHLDKFFLILAVLLILTCWIAVRRKPK
jgi:hypothetical protein